MDKRKIQYGIVVLMLAFVFVGCGQKKKNAGLLCVTVKIGNMTWNL